MKRLRRNSLFYGIGILILLVLATVSLFVGRSSLSLAQILNNQSVDWQVLTSVRLPRAFSVVVAGATLALSGLLAQQLTQNRFASPATMGTFASGRLGLILALLFLPGSNLSTRAIFAFVLSLLGTFAFVKLLDSIRLKDTYLVPIIGIIFGNVIQALGSYLAIQSDISQEVSAWLQGSFASVHSQNYQLLYFSIIALVLIILASHYFSILGLGKEIMTELGASYERIRFISVALIALGTAAVLLTVGNIPFVGIIIPNIVAYFNGDHFQKNIPAVLLAGPIFLLVCDILSRLIIAPYELPVSIIVGVIGSLVFITMMLRGRRV